MTALLSRQSLPAAEDMIGNWTYYIFEFTNIAREQKRNTDVILLQHTAGEIQNRMLKIRYILHVTCKKNNHDVS